MPCFCILVDLLRMCFYVMRRISKIHTLKTPMRSHWGWKVRKSLKWFLSTSSISLCTCGMFETGQFQISRLRTITSSQKCQTEGPSILAELVVPDSGRDSNVYHTERPSSSLELCNIHVLFDSVVRKLDTR